MAVLNTTSPATMTAGVVNASPAKAVPSSSTSSASRALFIGAPTWGSPNPSGRSSGPHRRQPRRPGGGGPLGQGEPRAQGGRAEPPVDHQHLVGVDLLAGVVGGDLDPAQVAGRDAPGVAVPLDPQPALVQGQPDHAPAEQAVAVEAA